MNLAVQKHLNDCVHELLALAAKAHQWHLAAKSYAQHMALGELYDYAHDAADALAEKAMGAGYAPPPPASWPLQFSGPEKAVAEAERVAACVGGLNEACKAAKLDWLGNVAQEVQGALNGILYKLKRLS